MKVDPAAAVRGAIAVPGNKGISQRAVLLGALTDGESEIRGFGRAADTETAISVVRQLGVEVQDEGGETVRVRGLGLRGLREPDEPLDCGNAGTVLRLATGMLAGQEGRFVLTGDESLSRRPHERVAEPLRLMGARVETTNGGAPLRVEGGRLRAIRYELPVASAQVKSAVLLAGLFADGGPTTVVERVPTRDHTERLLRELGVRVARRGADVAVSSVHRLAPFQVDIAGDFSSAAPFILAATLLHGSELLVEGVNVNPLRTGFLDVLERMGANIAVFNRRAVGGEPVADLEVRPAELVATAVRAREVPALIDELPLFGLAGGMARGESVVRGARELRAKETDRIETVTNALRALGVRVAPGDDGFRVRGVPTRPRGGGVVEAAGDHRIAMLGAIGGMVSREGVRIEGAESVAVSFPGFFDLLDSVTQR
ncbi:MAG TPA: 3-phosphoshikimate 1-carboxyvinyltransferase [Gaiellaceae bacterium]|nr:3-phosphoshikimate 1-carboxyvinyltransferase [Gaiellaceae bacterium]